MVRTERPATRVYRQFVAALVCALLLGGCAGKQPDAALFGLANDGGSNGTAYAEELEDFSPAATRRSSDPLYNADRVVLDDVTDPLEIRDPFEPVNRAMYSLNAQVDRYFLLPIVGAYRKVIPGFARQGVTNFFDNLDDIRTGINQLLQLRPKRAAETGGRFLTNSTLGLAGLLDPASRFGIPKHDEDFGQTLGHYNVGPGPYLVLPLFGPSGLRDGLGRAVDAGVLALLDPLNLERYGSRRYAYYPLLVIDTRATTAFEYFDTGSPFEYELLRMLYTRKRELDIVK